LVIFDLEMETNLKYKNITEKILGASFDVHSFLGNGCRFNTNIASGLYLVKITNTLNNETKVQYNTKLQINNLQFYN
jgi:hypothetical protein